MVDVFNYCILKQTPALNHASLRVWGPKKKMRISQFFNSSWSSTAAGLHITKGSDMFLQQLLFREEWRLMKYQKFRQFFILNGWVYINNSTGNN